MLAHELGHHVNRDIPLLMLFGAFTNALGLYLASLALLWAVDTFGFEGAWDVAALPVLLLIMNAYSLIIMPIENGFLRWRERKADEYVLRAAGKTNAFASAFVRLANQNLGEIDPGKWVVWMFYSHPPLGERIEMAKRWKSI